MSSGSIDGYQLGRTLGSGYSAKVKLAVDAKGEQYALKIFDLTKQEINEKATKFVTTEVEATKSLSHKHIAKYFEC